MGGRRGRSGDEARQTGPMDAAAAKTRPLHQPPQPERPDHTLILRSLSGDTDAFGDLVLETQDRIHALLGRFARDHAEVEDLAQEVFLKAYNSLPRFRFTSSFYTWVYRIAVNTALDACDKRKRNPVHSVEDVEIHEREEHQRTDRPETDMIRAERIALTRELLDELPDIFRTVLVLRELEGMRYDEMARTLGVSIGTIESRLYRGRARFEKLARAREEDLA